MPTLPVETQPISRLALLQQARDRHRHDAVLVGEARALGGVVLQVQVRDPQLGAEPVGADQRRVAGELARPVPARGRRRSAAAPRSARCCCGRSARGHLGEVAGRQLVVVDDVQALAAVRAGEHRSRRAASCARSGGRPARSRTSASAAGSPAGAVRSGCSCGHLERYAGPRRLCGALLVAEREPQLLGEVRRERAEHLDEHRERRRQRLEVGGAEAPARARARVSRSP